MDVSYSDAFKRQIRRLSRKYRRIRSDVQPLISQLEAGETPGDQIQGPAILFTKSGLKIAIANVAKAAVIGSSIIW